MPHPNFRIHLKWLLALAACLAACSAPSASGLPTANVQLMQPTAAQIEMTLTPSPSQLAPTAALSATPEATPSATLVASGVTFLPASASINVRAGPGTDYEVLGQLSSTEVDLPILGRQGQWLLIPYGDARGWVFSDLGVIKGELNAAPLVAAPPTALITNAPQTTASVKTPQPSSGQHGVSGTLTLCDPDKPTFATLIERICFRETIFNTNQNEVKYGKLGVQITNQSNGMSQFHASWTGAMTLAPRALGPTADGWEDGITLQEPGTYRLVLRICFSTEGECANLAADWETLTPAITITVINWTPSP